MPFHAWDLKGGPNLETIGKQVSSQVEKASAGASQGQLGIHVHCQSSMVNKVEASSTPFHTIVEARKLEHCYPHALKAKYRGSQHYSS